MVPTRRPIKKPPRCAIWDISTAFRSPSVPKHTKVVLERDEAHTNTDDQLNGHVNKLGMAC